MSLRWIPNLICLLRIAMVPMVVGAIATQRIQLALGLFFIAGFSDGLDGFLARRFGWHTQVGAILDQALAADRKNPFVKRAVRLQLIQEPQPLLGKRQRQLALPIDTPALELLYVIIALAMPLVAVLPSWLPRAFELVLIVTITASGANYVIAGIRRARQRSDR